MGLRIALVVMLLALISYVHLMLTLETGTLTQLEKYVIERGKHEEELFQLAADNHALLKQELLKRLSSQDNELKQCNRGNLLLIIKLMGSL